ncbi:MAG TPA: translocation/assembly module TamB domain-containing protein [Steroidobacteraceae bacterium]|nr:translocation/assembly module TamB domain-containing protein [Steroidobacteraceae bacterium]
MSRGARIAAWSVGGLLLLLILIVIAAVVIIGNTAGGRRLLESETAKLTSGRVRIAGLGGTFPAEIDIASLQLSDPKGVWLTAQRVAVHWSPLALLAWNMHIERIEIGAADVARRPVSSPSAASRSSSSSSGTPAINIDRMSVDTLVLEPAAAGMSARLNMEGNLHYRSLQNAQAHLVARRTNGMGDYEVALALSRASMNARLELREPAGGPLEHLLNLPGLGALSVAASLDGPRHAEELRLNAHAGQLSANANGTVDLVQRAANLTYSLASPAMTPKPGLAWRRIALNGRWVGPVAAPRATGVLDLEGLELSDGARLDSLTANLAADGRVLRLRATASGIILAGSQPQLLAGSPLALGATLHLDSAGRPLQLTLDHRLVRLSAHAVTSGDRSVTFDLTLPDVGSLASLYHEDISGTMHLSGKVAEQRGSTLLDVSGNGDLAGSSVAAKLLGADTTLHLAGSMTTAMVDVDTLELSGRGLTASAWGSAERSGPGASTPGVQSLRVHWRVSLPKLQLISPSVAGSLDTSGTVDGPMRSLTADVGARSKLTIPGAPPGTVEATLRARNLPSAPSAEVHANGMLAGAPLRLDGSLEQVAANTFRVVIPHLTWKSLAINGDLTAGRSLATARGTMRVRLEHLADLQPFVGKGLEGSIAGNIALTPAACGARTQLDVLARNIRAGGVSGNGHLTAAGPLDALRIQLIAQSPDIHGSPASLATEARLDETRHVLDLDRFEARYREQTAHLMSPSRVMFARGLTVRNLRLGMQKAVVAVDGQLSPALNFRASIEHVDAALVNAFVPHLLTQGTFNAHARLKGTRSAPVGQASLRIAGLKLANTATQGLPAVGARGSARFLGKTANIFAELDAGSDSRLRMSGRAPLASTGTVALRVAGKLDAALINSILEARGERAAGKITIDATVAGTAHEPQIHGVMQLANGDLRDYAQGIHLGDINARLVGGRGILRIASMTARAGPGKLSATGTVGVLQPGMPIDVTLSAKNIQPVTNDIMTANLDTNMHVAGSLKQRLDVTGLIHVNRASISIPNGLPPSVATLDVIRPGEAPQPTAAATQKLVIGLGISLDAPDAIFVQGRGLDAQLGGRLQIKGTSDNPQVSGGFRMIRGTFALAGTSLKFTSGKVSFNGEGLKGRIDPTLDFIAQSSVIYNGPTTVTLHVTGFADSPKIALSSNPSLPQDDLLGLLLFGKPAAQLSALQLAETGAALASLSGIGPGGGGGGGSKWNPLTWIKKGLGLNTLSVGSAGSSGGGSSGGGTQSRGASVTAGKYISKRVYLAATQTTNGTSQVQVDIDLSQYLKLQTRLGNGTATAQGTTPENDPGSSIGLAWQMPY